MKSRPILFSAPMVRALLAGTKTQTRRIVKDAIQPGAVPRYCEGSSRSFDIVTPERPYSGGMKLACLVHGTIHCPYGAPGDRLWVRERARRVGAVLLPNGRPRSIDVQYEADKALRLDVPFPDRLKVPEHGKCLSMGCYREASRITLEITGVRVERLQAISVRDVEAEGIKIEDIPMTAGADFDIDGGLWPRGERLVVGAYRTLWESINGPGSWDANPWVWVVEFKRVDA